MVDVFVSYKAEDRVRVRPLVEALQADGLAVWWDAHIDGGDDWRESIAANLDAAKCVIVAWSKRSAGPDGRFVRDEAGRAVKRHVYLPVTIDKVDPPLGFGETQCLPLSGWKGDRDDPRYLALLDRARRVVGGDGAAPSAPTPQRARTDRRTVLTVGTTAGVALAGGAGWYLLRGSAPQASVAVLPFANLSGDPSQAYFSDGLAEELRSALARIPGLKVMARTSSEMLRDADAKAAAAKLGVATIVSGSVRRSPSMIRVSAQLIDGSNGLERWSQTFDRPPGDVLVVQSSIAENVAQELRGQFGAADRAALGVGGTENARAQDFILQAQAGATGEEAGYRQAIALTDAAIALDPQYALAYAVKALMMASWASVYAVSAERSRAGLAQAALLARRSVALDARLADSHQALAFVLRNQCDMGASLAELARAVALPGCPANVVAAYAQGLAECLMFDQAFKVLRRAEVVDPLNTDLVRARAYIFYSAHRFGEAIPLFERFLADRPKQIQARNFYAIALLFAGRIGEAAAQFKMLPLDDFHRWVGEAAIALRAGDRAFAEARLEALKVRYGSAANFQYAQIAAQRRDINGGIAALQAAWTERDTGLPRIKIDPYVDPLRKDPRFAAVVAKLNYPGG
jgi:serine/threonine-protein kinase